MMPSPGGFLECRGYELVDSPDDSTPVPPIVWFPPPVPIRSSSLKYELVESSDGVTLPLNWFHPPVPIRSSSLTQKSIPLSMETTDESGYQVPRRKLLQKELLHPDDPTPPPKSPRKFRVLHFRVAPPVPFCAPFGKKKIKEYRVMDKDWEVKSLKF
ncbi:hypothetical protein CRE_13416 [Caenorhabditis remanei]|uniref:Uncharacterized protein n=1 Tax=Caenorhabditis remanei TaxID=31234 RepID=E3M881_CAERE|nr:hypothetical protein CRE_13416 [Caenorhabditis remanei]